MSTKFSVVAILFCMIGIAAPHNYPGSQRSLSLFPNFLVRRSTIFSPKVRRTEFLQFVERVEDLEVLLETFTTRLDALEELVSNIRPGCPSTAPGAVVIGNLCFSLETVPQTYETAKQMCFQMGGMLAEPQTNDEDFYARIVTALPVETNSVSSSQIYLQIISNGVGGFFYENSNVVIPNTDSRWAVTPATPAANEAAALQPSGTSWELIEITNRNTMTLPYLCQYDTVL